ncbi:MAG: ankyrin repeat domain-containing protein [Alphaproteobacteria bacterium]|nr:ankyrin repeat domain-containing protein [Alphaproteobacteria bacterium]
MAIWKKREPIVECLVEHGADVNARNKYGLYPFIVSCNGRDS